MFCRKTEMICEPMIRLQMKASGVGAFAKNNCKPEGYTALAEAKRLDRTLRIEHVMPSAGLVSACQYGEANLTTGVPRKCARNADGSMSRMSPSARAISARSPMAGRTNRPVRELS